MYLFSRLGMKDDSSGPCWPGVGQGVSVAGAAGVLGLSVAAVVGQPGHGTPPQARRRNSHSLAPGPAWFPVSCQW